MVNEKTSIQAFGKAYDYAGFWVRFGATVIDSIILLMITILTSIAIYGIEYLESGQSIVGFWDFIITWILPVMAVIMFWNWKQATPGKMAFKAIIVDEKTGVIDESGEDYLYPKNNFIVINFSSQIKKNLLPLFKKQAINI